MKLTLFLSILTIFQLWATETYSQMTKLTLKLEDVKISDALKEIENQSEFFFLYSPKLIDVERKVNIEAKNEPIKDILSNIFGEKVKFAVWDRQVILTQSDVTSLSEALQQLKIAGTVTDETGSPLPGVNIQVEGTTIGAISDADGKYSINIPNENAVLIFSFIGYNTQKVSADGKTTIDISLVPAMTSLEDVVVIGYGTQKKVNLTGSIASVKTDQLGNIPAANLSNMIAGRAAGVTVVGNSGLAGAYSEIRIRGSFSEPLYVINGIIKSKSDFDALDATEVESINFLKDAASASIYGSKAGNGVVLVTTKAGLIQKPIFEYKGSYSFSSPTRPIPNITATQEIEFINQVAVTAGQPKPYGQEIYDYFKDKSYAPNDYLWQTPTVQQHNISVRGGSEVLTYYLSLGTHNEEGSYKKLSYDKYNFRSDVTANISKRIKVNIKLSGNQRDYHRWNYRWDAAESFTVPDFYREKVTWSRLYPFYVDEQGNPTTNTNAYPVNMGDLNPVSYVLNDPGYIDVKYRTLDGIIRFDLDLGDLVDGLSTSLQGQENVYDRNQKNLLAFNKTYILQFKSGTNPFIPAPIDPTKTYVFPMGSSYEHVAEAVDLYNSYQINWFLKYERTFGKHALSALGVYEQNSSKGKYLSGRADQLLTSGIDQIYNASTDPTKRWFTGNEGESANASWIGRLNYGFDNKYIAEISFRYDGNYKFAPGKQWGFFPSFSAAWRISKERFLDNVPWLSNLKLRGSYGSSGNDDVSAFRWSQTYSKSTGYIFGTSLYDGLVPGAMPNPEVTWSTSEMLDVGLDYGFLNNRLNGEIDFFTRTQSNILGTRLGSTPSTLGATLPSVNYAKRSWKGYEISVNWNDKAGDFNYSVYADMGYSVDQWDIIDEAKALTDGTYKDNWRSSIGKPGNRLYGLISKGLIRTQEELDKLPAGFTQYGRTPKLGYILFEDIRGANYSEGPDGKIDDNDMTYLSDNATPRINYGLGFRLEWKGLGLNAHFQGVGAYDRMISVKDGQGVFQVGRPYFEIWASNYWTPENPNAKYPRVAGEWFQQDMGGGPSTFWLRNGAYMRLKNLDISYTLPKKWLNKLGIDRVQLYTNVTNLFCISGFDEHDPEQSTLDSYPIMKTFTGGLSINF